jgi:hypothetical protein
MFCPICGKENPGERKFCVACGTNLEVVFQALSGSKTDFFTKFDAALDQFIARYAEHVFKQAPVTAADRKVSSSWKLLGQGVLTCFADFLLSFLMWNALTVRFQILLISTPFRLLIERSNRQKSLTTEFEEQATLNLPAATNKELLPGPVVSVSEHTTERLQERLQSEQNRAMSR